MASPDERPRLAAAAALCFAAAFLVFLPTLRFPFLWDDRLFIIENPFLSPASNAWRAVALFFTRTVEPVAGGARPLWIASLAWDRWLWDLAPAGFHFTNVLLHAANAALAVAFARRLFGRALPAFLAGLAFALHPVHVESVASVGYRTDLLALFFALASALLYWRAQDAPSFKRAAPLYAAALAAYAAALLSKEAAAPLPAALAAWEFLRRPWREAVRRCWPLLLFLAALLFYAHQHFRRFHYDPAQSLGAVASVDVETLLPSRPGPRAAHAAETPPAGDLVYRDGAANAATMSVVFARYVGKLLWPLPLCPEYAVRLRAGFDAAAAAALALLAGAIAAAWLLRARAPALSGGLAWFLLFLAPVSNVSPLANLMAERYLYLPSLGFVVALVAALGLLGERFPAARRAAPAFFGALFVFWASVCVAQSRLWSDEFRLFSRAIRCAPDNFRPWYNAGLVLQRQGQWEKAVSHYRQAAERAPQRREIYANLGRCYEELGDPAAAEAMYRRVLALDPKDPVALVNLGNLAFRAGRPGDALALYEEALRGDPAFYMAAMNIGEVRASRGDWEGASAAFRHVVDRRPDHAGALYALGDAQLRLGAEGGAREAWRKLLELHPDHPRKAEIVERLGNRMP